MSISTLPTPSERLHARVAEVAGVLNRAHAQLVELTAELIDTETWADGGVVSPAHWLTLRAGLSDARARQVVALASRRSELPATMAAFDAGEISLEQVTPIARHVPAEFEGSVLELARHATVRQITRAASGTDFTPLPSYEDNQARLAAEQEAERTGHTPTPEPVRPPSLSMHHDRGRFHLRYEAPSDIGALVEVAVREATDAIWRRRNGLSPQGVTDVDDEATQERRATTRSAPWPGRADTSNTDPAKAPGQCTTGRRSGIDAVDGSGATTPMQSLTFGPLAAGSQAGVDPTSEIGAENATCGPAPRLSASGPQVDAVSGPGASYPTESPTSGPLTTGPCTDVDSTSGLGTAHSMQGSPPGPLTTGSHAEVDHIVGVGGEKTSLADGFAEIANRSLEGVTSTSRRDRYRVYVHLDTRGAHLTGRPPLPHHIAESLTCDGHLQPVWMTEGAPVNVGRTQRIVPERTRRLLDDRDRGCRYPGCPSGGFTEKHHIIHWLLGGRTDTANLVSICPAHHDAHHRGEFMIHGNPDLPDDHPDGLAFTHYAGLPITYTPPKATPREAPLPAGAPYAGPTGEPMYARNVVFTPSTPATVAPDTPTSADPPPTHTPDPPSDPPDTQL